MRISLAHMRTGSTLVVGSVTLALSFVAVGCMQPFDDTDGADDDPAFENIEQMPKSPVCSGNIHCDAHVQTESARSGCR